MRQRFTRSVLRLSGLAAAATVGLLAAGTSAGAATVSGIPAVAGPSQISPKVTSIPESFSCDFSAYGGPATVTGSATFTVPTSVTAGAAIATAFRAPSGVATALGTDQQVGTFLSHKYTFSLTGVAMTDASGASLQVASTSTTAVPVAADKAIGVAPLTVTDSATVQHAGTAHITGPAGFTIIPVAGDATTPAINCTIAGGAHTYAVTVAPVPSPTPTPTTPAAGSGPVYRCVVSATGLPQGTVHETVSTPIPMALSSSGPEQTGHSVLITLSSGAAGLGAPYPLPATSLVFSGALSVQGAQHGAIALRRTTAQVGKTTFTVSGALPLTQPGADRVYLPGQFTFTVVGPYYPGTHRRVDFITACTATPSAQVGLRLTVTGQPVAVSGHGGSTNGSGTAASGAVPAGAPNTGGGTAPGSALPLILGGVALLLAGGGGTVFAIRRRRLSPPSA